MTSRREMSIMYKTEGEAQSFLREHRASGLPPMWPILDVRVERRSIGDYRDPANIRWVVTGDYSAWDRATC